MCRKCIMHVSNRWSDERQRCGAVPTKTGRIFTVSERQCNIYKRLAEKNWFPVWVRQSGVDLRCTVKFFAVDEIFPPGFGAVRLNWKARANNKIIKKFQNLFPGEIFYIGTLPLRLTLGDRESERLLVCTEYVICAWIWEDLRSIYEISQIFSLSMKFLCGLKVVLSYERKLRAKMEEESIPRLLMLYHSVISEIIADEWMLLASGIYIVDLFCIFDCPLRQLFHVKKITEFIVGFYLCIY